MAKPLTPAQLLSALDKWGVKYKEYPNWKTRTRPGSLDVNGIMVHHTGGPFTESDAYLKFLFETGQSSSVPGPLCNFAIGPTGTVHIGSVGRTNNAGAGRSEIWAAIKAENYDGFNSELKPASPDNWSAANGHYWGIEICYPGTQPMTADQYSSTVRLVAALVDAYGWSALSALAHREHTTRKWDPGQCPLDKFRRDVRDLLAAGPGGTVSGGRDEDMFPSRGDTGQAVEYWQRILRELGFFPTNVNFAEIYGPATNTAVNDFRESIGLGRISNTRISPYIAQRLHRGLAEKYSGSGTTTGPTQKQVTDAVNAWLEANKGSLKGEDGKDATVEEVTAAVTKWLNDNRDSLKGEDGKPGRTPTKFGLFVDVVEYEE